MQFNLSADMLAAAMAFTSAEETRRYMHGVYVESQPDPDTGLGALIVATDGHKLCAFYDALGHVPEAAILQVDGKSKDLKTGAREVADRRLVFDRIEPGQKAGAAVHIQDSPVTFTSVQRIAGTFPDWRRVMPKVYSGIGLKDGQHLAVNPAFVAICAEAARRISAMRSESSDGKVMRFATEGAGSPILLHTGSHNALFVIMPMGCDAPDMTSAPWWLAYPKPSTASTA